MTGWWASLFRFAMCDAVSDQVRPRIVAAADPDLAFLIEARAQAAMMADRYAGDERRERARAAALADIDPAETFSSRLAAEGHRRSEKAHRLAAGALARLIDRLAHGASVAASPPKLNTEEESRWSSL